MTTSRYRLAVKGMLATALLLWLPISCRLIIGIPGDDPVVDPKVLDEAGGGSDGSVVSKLCTDYCDAMDAYCTGKDQMYPSREACTSVCKYLPEGMQMATEGNSVSCRYKFASSHEGGECQNAGPLGGDVCGEHCEIYCDLLSQVCKDEFKTFTDRAGCLKVCGELPYKAPYSAEKEPHEDSLSCRMYHLSSATFSPERHCPHTIGKGYCPDPDAGGGSDGGSGGGGGGGSGNGSSSAGGGASGDGGIEAGSGSDAGPKLDGGSGIDAGPKPDGGK